MASFIQSPSALVNAVKNIVDKTAQLTSLCNGYASDYAHFAQANNRDRLALCASAFSTKGALHKALTTAMGAGFIAGAINTGFISRGTGGFSTQAVEIAEPFNAAMRRAGEAFEASLIESGLFANKTAKTDAEKQTAKEAKEAKAKEAKEALITLMIQSGEIVRAIDAHGINEMSVTAILEYLKIEDDNIPIQIACFGFAETTKMQAEYAALQTANSALQAEYAALQTANSALQAEYAALQTAKPAKAEKLTA